MSLLSCVPFRLAVMFPCILLTPLAGAGQRLSYPPARTVDVVDELHGVKVADPYRWLEAADDPEVQAWTEQQNQLTRRCLDQFPEFRAELSKQFEKLLAATVGSTPGYIGGRYFFSKRTGLQNHAVVYVRDGSLTAEPRVLIDPNTFSDDGTVALDWWIPSPDGKLVVYGRSASGSEKSTLYLRDIATAKDLDLTIPFTRYCSVAWDVDCQGFTYTRYPEPGTVPPGDENYLRHAYYHKLGTDWRNDPKIWGEGRPKEESVTIFNSDDDRYQFLTTSLDWAKNDVYVRPMGATEFKPVVVGGDGQFTPLLAGERLFILTNENAPRYHVMVTDVTKPAPEHWREVIPQMTGVINAVTIAGDKLIVEVMENAFSRLFIYDFDGHVVREIKLPTLGSVDSLSARVGRPEFFFAFQSFAFPPVVYRYDLKTNEMTVIDRMELDAKLDDFTTEQVWFNSKDGTRVPMFVTHRKDMKLDGSNACVIYGYGGFDISITPSFDVRIFPWIERGGVYAVANIRGGGEFGKDWHLAARMEKKQNCFDDFIAAGEKLIADGYTKPERLGARGGSNGGLLMGAMAIQRPDLFHAIQCAVPLLDMLRYQNYRIARLWIPEYGVADDPEQFKFLYAYSPYHHVQTGTKYPAILFTTADSDSRVDPMHARKMAARMQAATGGDLPILLWVESKAGHGAGKPLSKRLEELVDDWTFFGWQLGVIKEQPAPAAKP